MCARPIFTHSFIVSLLLALHKNTSLFVSVPSGKHSSPVLKDSGYSAKGNNALSAIQKEMYKNKKILSTLSLFAENMPFPNKQHLEILIQAFPTNPAPNVRMTPTFYLIIIGDSRQEMQNNN